MAEYTQRYSFLESFYRCTQYMTDEQKLIWYEALNAFAFDGVEPEFEDNMFKILWEQTCTLLTRSIKDCKNGAKGGAAKGASKGGKKGASKGGNSKIGNPPKYPPSNQIETEKESEIEKENEEKERREKLDQMYSQNVTVFKQA